MINTLADARLDFAGNAKDRVTGLNGRLEGAVSRVPPRKGESGHAEKSARPTHVDVEYDDATACFTREEGTQTTDAEAMPARTTTFTSTSSSSSLDFPSTSKPNTSISSIDDELASLSSIQNLLSSQATTAQSEEDATDSIHSSLSDLRSYLAKLEAARYTSSGIQGLSGYGYGGASVLSEERGGKWGSKVEEKTDEIKEVKKAIGEVKGVLLSARNFPSVKVR